MNIFEFIGPFLIFLIPVVIKSFAEKQKANKKQNERNINGNLSKERNAVGLENIEAIPPMKDDFGKNIKEKKERVIKHKVNEKIKSEIKKAKENKVEQNKKYEVNIEKEPKATLKISKNDKIKKNEIGSDNIQLKFDKESIVKGIVMSEILSSPKALKGKK
ncbi:hypothetical protein GOQ29_06525 [Clostridium sp. D2Q-14]|uniref:hypothetical protein n=1 Tax=Anaeromonas gelatinilytica TaxID=2683194 RepID=UPI00193C701A|nr:hypothetical protein [Anaeromonas gelatinilytica]MBS4535271.1 hypothetical protein [Anaeromonas gelatinilytica]